MTGYTTEVSAWYTSTNPADHCFPICNYCTAAGLKQRAVTQTLANHILLPYAAAQWVINFFFLIFSRKSFTAEHKVTKQNSFKGNHILFGPFQRHTLKTPECDEGMEEMCSWNVLRRKEILCHIMKSLHLTVKSKELLMWQMVVRIFFRYNYHLKNANASNYPYCDHLGSLQCQRGRREQTTSVSDWHCQWKIVIIRAGCPDMTEPLSTFFFKLKSPQCANVKALDQV